jgi:hypothetical protein
VLRQRLHVTATTAGNHDPRGFPGIGHAAPNQIGGHQSGDIDADIQHIIAKRRRLNAVKNAMQTFFRELAGEEQNVFGHEM